MLDSVWRQVVRERVNRNRYRDHQHQQGHSYFTAAPCHPQGIGHRSQRVHLLVRQQRHSLRGRAFAKPEADQSRLQEGALRRQGARVCLGRAGGL